MEVCSSVGKTSRQTSLFHRLLYWPHIAWGRCQHYETESTLWTNRVHHFLNGTGFSPRLRDKIWKWPGNESLSADQTCTSALWVINYSYMIIRLQKKKDITGKRQVYCGAAWGVAAQVSSLYSTYWKLLSGGLGTRLATYARFQTESVKTVKTSLYVSHLVIHKSWVRWIQIQKYPAIQWVSGI